MATTTPSSALVATAPVFTDTERLALAEFLADDSGVSGRSSRRNHTLPNGTRAVYNYFRWKIAHR